MMARGFGHGDIFNDSSGNTRLPLNTPLSEISQTIWFRSSPELLDTYGPPSRRFKVFGVNSNKLKKKFAYFDRLLMHHDYDIIFFSETRIKHRGGFRPLNYVNFNKNNTPYGCGAMYNSTKYHQDELNIVDGSPFHVHLRLQNVSIIYIYKPPNQNCLDFYDKFIAPSINKECIIFGDFNIPLNSGRTLTHDQILFFDLLNIAGYTVFDIPDEFTFEGDNGGRSKIDHIFYKESDAYHILNAGTIDTIGITDHKCLFIELELQQTAIFLRGNRSTWNRKRFKDEDKIFEFQNHLSVDLIRCRGDLHQLLFNWEFCNDPKTKQKYCNESWDKIRFLFHTAGINVIGETKPHKHVSTSQIASVAEELELGNSEVADRILVESRKLSIKSFKETTNQMASYEFLKFVKMSTWRKSKTGASLDMHKWEEYMTDWTPKWDLRDLNEFDYIPQYDNTLPDMPNIINTESLSELIKALPKGKSPGEDLIINEFIINCTDEMKDFISLGFNMIVKTGVTPLMFHRNIIIPVHKGQDLPYDDIHSNRPIALSSVLKKLFEMSIKSLIKPFLDSGQNQYAYK